MADAPSTEQEQKVKRMRWATTFLPSFFSAHTHCDVQTPSAPQPVASCIRCMLSVASASSHALLLALVSSKQGPEVSQQAPAPAAEPAAGTPTDYTPGGGGDFGVIQSKMHDHSRGLN